MKNCKSCRFLNGYECEIFGDYCPDCFALSEGCMLKFNEAVKLKKLTDNVLAWNYCVTQNEKQFDNDFKAYNDYLNKLKQKYTIKIKKGE